MASSIIPKALNGDISSLNDSLANSLGHIKNGIKSYTDIAFEIVNSVGSKDFSDDFSAVYFCLATIANTSSGQIITSNAISGTTVSVTCVPRSNMTSTTNNASPVVRFFVYGRLR